MKPVHRHTLLMGSLLLGLSTAYPLQAAPLSDFEQFRSYPYMDRSYREAKKGNWKEVERLMRHLLEKVPKNDEARALLVESLAKQRRYKEALQALPDDSNALLDLRLTWIEQDPPTSTQVESWMATSSLNDRVRLWQAYSLSLAKFGGAAKAHDWLAQLAPKGDDNILRLARANWSEQLRDWSGTIDQLAPLAARKELDAEGWQRLATPTYNASMKSRCSNCCNRRRVLRPRATFAWRWSTAPSPWATSNRPNAGCSRCQPATSPIQRNVSDCGNWRARPKTCLPCSA